MPRYLGYSSSLSSSTISFHNLESTGPTVAVDTLEELPIAETLVPTTKRASPLRKMSHTDPWPLVLVKRFQIELGPNDSYVVFLRRLLSSEARGYLLSSCRWYVSYHIVHA